ncbi:serine hydrolase domain-containing protein [Streptomyces sp. NPDC093085]|uniref:serine hydrolase domain-containing protein n=1 Tax=Streptomyces sp. NPDC093085 TaxID=3155068 RepID=UPI00344582BC
MPVRPSSPARPSASAPSWSPRRTLRGALALALVAGLGGTLLGCSAVDEADAAVPAGRSEPVSPAPTTAELARLAQRAADSGSLGVIVRVDRGSGKPVEIARQTAWTREDHRLAPGDQFRVGSNTKTMVATVVLQLVAEGRVKLTDPVEKWLPGVVPGGRDITLTMLLDHTSGLGDFLFAPEFLPSMIGQDERTWTPRELLAITPAQEPPATPGEKHFYSNANYIALGMVVEKATGRSLAEVIEERITKPLGMKDTFLATDARWDPEKKHAAGYEPGPARLGRILAEYGLPEGTGFAGPERPDDNVDTTGLDSGWSGAAAGMVSTARDWQRFLTALDTGKLLSGAQLRQMRTTVPAPDSGGGYGLGVMRVDTVCGTVWGHTGSLPGYSSEIYTDGTGRRGVAVLTATNFGVKEPKAAAANKALTDAAVCAMLGKPVPAGAPAHD